MHQSAPPHGPRALIRLARPTQWSKGLFVVLGPLYGFASGTPVPWLALVGAVLAFGFASSACYIVNDIKDRDADRLHPRKRRRPIASGAVSVSAASVFAGVMLLLAALSIFTLGDAGRAAGPGWPRSVWLGLAVLIYVLNVTAYSMGVKRVPILDVMSLASGFVLRVLGGCAATGVEPSSWLLNSTFFLAMFLAFGKRLGERRTMNGSGTDPGAAAAVRAVQRGYTDDLLRMAVVVTGVATLVTYSGYVEANAAKYTAGFNLLWLTMLPATYALLRCIVLLEQGRYDDPTELASHDPPFQASVVLFGVLTAVLVTTFTGVSIGLISYGCAQPSLRVEQGPNRPETRVVYQGCMEDRPGESAAPGLGASIHWAS